MREVQFTDAWDVSMLQQSLPFTVLKLSAPSMLYTKSRLVATVLTVYGIETFSRIL